MNTFEFVRYGSSPWLRGTQQRWNDATQSERFIPVATGNTASEQMQLPSKTVHPRGYGEHLFTGAIAAILDGSSPWLRGTLFSIAGKHGYIRFIPVATGNTKCYRLNLW